MNDLQQFQIKQSCKLALPNGLQELMSDISREVLRSQPKDIYNFITEYLGALLEARDNLAIAAQICEEVCHSSCQPELEDELKDIGLKDEEIKLVVNVVQKYFEEGQGKKVNETTLLMKLSKIINVGETVLEALLDAVRAAFRNHFINNAVKYKTNSSEEDEDDRAAKAAKNTVKFYENEMFTAWDPETKVDNNGKMEKQKMSVSSMSLAGSYMNLPKLNPYVATQCCRNRSGLNESPEKEQMSSDYNEETKQHIYENEELECTSFHEKKKVVVTVSSISLAGSYMTLPKHNPYTAIQCCRNLSTVEEYPEKEQMNVDYTEVTNSRKKTEDKHQSEVEIEPKIVQPEETTTD